MGEIRAFKMLRVQEKNLEQTQARGKKRDLLGTLFSHSQHACLASVRHFEGFLKYSLNTDALIILEKKKVGFFRAEV